MKTVVDLLSPDKVEKLATPSNFKLGQGIAENGKVEIVQFSPSIIKAKIFSPGKSLTRTVAMVSTKNGLEYRCTCSSKSNWFCKHCVAVGLAMKKELPVKIK